MLLMKALAYQSEVLGHLMQWKQLVHPSKLGLSKRTTKVLKWQTLAYFSKYLYF